MSLLPRQGGSSLSGGGREPGLALERLGSFEAVEEAAMEDVALAVEALAGEYEEIMADVASYDAYLENVDRIEAFYEKAVEDTARLCLVLRERSANYAVLALRSDASGDAAYDSLEGLYDSIYEDAFERVYDEIYEGIFDDMYDSLYDGVLKGAYKSVPYDQWSDVVSEEYSWWSDARSDVYSEWSDARSDVYGLWSDLRGDVYSGKDEKAQKELDRFEEDIVDDRAKLQKADD